MPNPLLSRRAVALVKMESTYNVDSTPTAAADALLVSDPAYTVDPTVLNRNFVRNSMSPLAHKMGRMLAGMSFGLEFRGSGSASTAPKLGRLLRASGYAETQITSGAAQLAIIKADQANTGAAITWGTPVSGSQPTEPVLFTITCVLGGASGTATLSVTPDANAVAKGYAAASAAAVQTSGTAKTLTTGVTITPTWTGNLVAGDKWYVWWFPAGFLYSPVSTGFESVTAYLYRDGILHKLTGGRATFTITAEAGNYATMQFNLTGQYIAPTDTAMPTNPTYETTLPPVVENSNLTIDEYIQAVVAKFSFDQSNQIVPRQDMNNSDGYNGVLITGREPKGGIDPEMLLVANEDFWGNMDNAKSMYFRMRIGSATGNRQWVIAPAVQYTGLSYQDRDSLLTLDASLAFRQWQTGDDECYFFFG